MPHAVTHILVALIVADFIKDHIVKDRKKFPLYIVLVGGIAGLLPDIDVVVYWFLNILFKIPLAEVHRTFTHTLFFPLLFLVLALIFWKNRKYRLFFLMVTLGTFIHLVLDFSLVGVIRPFYPLSNWAAGLNIIRAPFTGTLIPGLDAILLVLWLIHEEKTHKISDFF